MGENRNAAEETRDNNMSQKWHIFKTPRKKGDMPIETTNYEPLSYLLQQKAMKYGPVIVITQEQLDEEIKNG